MKKSDYLFIILLFFVFISRTNFYIASAKTIEKNEPRVYITNYGECYHHSDCGYLWKSKRAIGLYQARQRGYIACFRCGGEADGTIKVEYYELNDTSHNSAPNNSTEIIICIFAGLFFGIVILLLVSNNHPRKKE